MGRIQQYQVLSKNFYSYFDCFKPFYNGFGIGPLVDMCFFSDFVANKFKIRFANYSYFRFGRVKKPTFRIISETYLVIFNSDKGFTLVELFHSIVEFKLSCDGFCFFVDNVN